MTSIRLNVELDDLRGFFQYEFYDPMILWSYDTSFTQANGIQLVHLPRIIGRLMSEGLEDSNRKKSRKPLK